MRSLQSGIALLCVTLLLAPMAVAQVPTVQKSSGFLKGLTHPYSWDEVTPVSFGNSSRLDALVRAGNLYLSLQDAIALALENNLDIQMQRYAPLNAQASLLRAQAGGPLRGVETTISTLTTSALSQITGGTGTQRSNVGGGGGGSTGGTIITATGTSIPSLDPSFYIVGSAGHATSPMTNSFTVGSNYIVSNNRNLNYGLTKSFITGTNIDFGWENLRAQSSSPRSDFNPFIDANARLTISQPLLRGFGLAVNTRNIRIAKNSMKVTDLGFKQQVISTVSAVIAGYWDLVSYNENVRVRQQALTLAQKLYDDNRKQVEIGTLAPIEIVRAEAEVASAQQALVNAETQVLQQENLMKNALSRTGIASPTISEVRIIPTDRIRVPEQEPIVPVQDLMAQALQSRVEVEQARLNLESSKIGLAGSRSQLLPSLGVQASFANNALAGVPTRGTIVDPTTNIIVPGPDPFFQGGWGTAIGQLFRRNFPDYSVAFSLNIPLRNRSAKADIIMDQVSLRRAEIQQQQLVNGIRVDVRNALTGLQQASAAHSAAVKARVLQEQNLDAEQKKYQLGASTVFLVIQAQRDLATARSQEVAAESQYAKAKVNLDQMLGRTLDVNNISIDEAVKGKVAAAPSALPVIQ
ncbi:MAG TPA: TolC family protein [Bryobacteraceae bacterium]|nr:TolC family protein [Bryobacteraceae bacterium]